MENLTDKLVLTASLLDSFREEVVSDPISRLATNACFKNDPLEMCARRDHLGDVNHIFTHKVETEGKPMSNQKSTGRCWIFACLNSMRLPYMKSINLDEFEFSQSHLFYWDKIERCNFFLNTIVDLLKRGENVDGRLISYLLHDPTCDGGQWDMLVNLISRYGVMPKKCFPDSYSAENSMRLNRILKSKLREYVCDLNKFITDKNAEGGTSSIVELITKQMKEIYRIVSICLGMPPTKFTWEYYDKSKGYHKIGPISPKEFYDVHVKPLFNVEEKVCIVNDPRPSNSYHQLYTVDCLGNMLDGRKVIYNNQPIEVLMSLAAESIKGGEGVWFGCEVAKRFAGKLGLHDLDMHDYQSLFGVEVHLGLTKAERLLYGESLMTHAMNFTGCSLDENGVATKWRVENSWGEDRGEKGYHIITSAWFKEFVFEVVVDRKYVPKEVLNVGEDIVVLPAWDPMGALARETAS